MNSVPDVSTRLESDSMGTVAVPAGAYFGASTQRALDNFPISDLRMPEEFLVSLARIKFAAAEVNCLEGILSREQAEAIKAACREVIDGKFFDQFGVDVFQTGSGTSTNMNMNEVLARRAREIAGLDAGEKAAIHPNDHVNASQSSNDVIPSALHLSALILIETALLPALDDLVASLRKKSRQFRRVVKSGRTHLNDATPVTLGQEFSGYAAQVSEARKSIKQAASRLACLTIGGTAVGTGVNAPRSFGRDVCALLASDLDLPVRKTGNHFRSQSTVDDAVAASGALKMLAVALIKIGNDIRWMGSGPRAGLGELLIPAVQPGSSIMPGKVNPVIAESVLMVAVQVIGNDAAITLAGQTGNFELNVMLPLVAYNLLQSIRLLSSACNNLRTRLIDGLEQTGRGPQQAGNSVALATSLAPVIGYDAAARIAKIAVATGESVFDVARRETSLPVGQLKTLLDPASMTRR